MAEHDGVRTFHRLVANTLLASVTNNFVWFALTFWVYLETRSVIASAVIGGTYMLLMAVSSLAFGTFVDAHRRTASMHVSSAASLALFAAGGAVYLLAPGSSVRDLGSPAFWLLTVFLLGGAIAGNLRTIALSTSVTLLVPDEGHARANGLVGMANGIGFAVTSVFSGLAIGLVGLGWSVFVAVVLTAAAIGHLATIRVEEAPPARDADSGAAIDVSGALRAVRAVPGLLGLLLFSTFNNLLSGVFMALADPYGLSLVSVETWGIVLAITSSGFILGGAVVARRGLGAHPVRTLLAANAALWVLCIVFPLRSSIVLLAVGFLLFMALIPAVEAAEQTVIQRVVPFTEQGRVLGFGQTLETAASPVSSFLVGPAAQYWAIPLMTTGAGAAAIGDWFGTGPDRGMALVFIVAGLIGLVATLAAFGSRTYRLLSARYAESAPDATEPVDVAVTG